MKKRYSLLVPAVLASTLLLTGCTNSSAQGELAYPTVGDLQASWISNGGVCENPSAATVVDFQGGKMIMCSQQNGIPVWFASTDAADMYAKTIPGTACIHASNWVISGADTQKTLDSLKTALGGEYCS